LGALVDLYVRNKLEKKAEARLKQHLAANGNDASAHLMLGSSYVRQKRLPEATPEFERALQLDPRLASAHLALGSVLQQEGQIDGAISRYRKALEIQPRQPAVQVMLGNLLLDKGDMNSARKYYEDAWAAAPNFGIAAGNLAWIYAEQGTNLDVALNLAQKARQLSPELDGVADTLGWVYYKRSAYAMAVPLFRECLRKAPDRGIYHYHLGMALLAQGDKQHARMELQSALRLKLAQNDARQAQAALGRL
jgi:tetratricopeptide (TPR) repeat protein